MSEHTKEPWVADAYGNILAGSPAYYLGRIDQDDAVANARRIVACVNACAGLDTEWLEDEQNRNVLTRMVHDIMENEDKVEQLQSANAELVEFLRELDNMGGQGREVHLRIQQAIAKHKASGVGNV